MDISLYDLALSGKQPPQPLAISPITLLSLIKSVIDLLVEQQISATLWVKLPQEEAWQTQIRRYHEQVGVAHAIYTCHVQTEAEKVTSLTTGDRSHQDLLDTNTSLVSVQLPADSQLKREYFLLVLSPQFCHLILAQSPRSKRNSPTLEKEEPKKARSLTAIYSFETAIIQQVLDGIKQAIIYSNSTTNLATETSNLPSPSATAHTELLTNWNSIFTCSAMTNPTLVSQLLTKQIQQQDDIKSNINARSAEEATTKVLQQQNQDLLNNLNLKEDFVNELCQELRTPLAHMKMALSLLNSPNLKLTQRQRYLQVLNTECDRQNSLINGLLELMQLNRNLEPVALQPVYLSEIVPGVVSTYQPLAQEKGIMLAYTVPEDLPAVTCLNSWLKQIVINLLHNSIKFTSSGGQVWVRASWGGANAPTQVQSNYVQLEFKDTGSGISTNDIPKIFDRFYRIRPVSGEDAGGAGLGLTVVQQLLLRCGGSIAVKSKLGEGTTFNVLFPVDQQVKSQ